jgi:hypothetical protein
MVVVVVAVVGLVAAVVMTAVVVVVVVVAVETEAVVVVVVVAVAVAVVTKVDPTRSLGRTASMPWLRCERLHPRHQWRRSLSPRKRRRGCCFCCRRCVRVCACVCVSHTMCRASCVVECRPAPCDSCACNRHCVGVGVWLQNADGLEAQQVVDMYRERYGHAAFAADMPAGVAIGEVLLSLPLVGKAYSSGRPLFLIE